MNCITDFLPDDTSEHNADGENMDEIVFGGKPAALKQVTWDDLSSEIQSALKYASSDGYITVEADKNPFKDSVALQFVQLMGVSGTRYLYKLTPAGRALLPAPTLTPRELDAAIYGTSEYWQQMSSASIEAHTETLERVKALEAENARLRAALENLAAEFTPTSPAPQPPTTDEQWNTLGTDARVIAHENFQHGVNVTLWRVSQKAHKALK